MITRKKRDPLTTSPCSQGIFTILRDRKTTREDFIFFTDRLSTFLSEKAMEFLPYATKDVTTPISVTYAGKQLAVDHVCGVSILRSYVVSVTPRAQCSDTRTGEGPLSVVYDA